MPACRTRASRGVPVPSPDWSLLAPVGGLAVLVGRRRRRTRCTSGSGCHGGPTLRRRGWGHPARAGTFLYARGHPARPGTGMLSPTASNAPGWKDTHPAAWNVPVVGDGQLDAGAQSRRTHLKARGLYPQGPCSWPQVRSRRRAGSVVRAYGVAGGRQGTSATETRGSCPHRRNARGPARCIPTRRTGRTSGADGDRHNTVPSKRGDWCPRPGKPGTPVI